MLKVMTGVLAGLLGLTASAAAQNYPTRPITMVIPFAAGGPTDVLGRVVGAKMSETLGQIGSPQAIAPLAEILKRKGRLGNESQEIRQVAARALLQIGTSEARSIVQSVVEAEPPGQARADMERELAERS